MSVAPRCGLSTSSKSDCALRLSSVRVLLPQNSVNVYCCAVVAESVQSERYRQTYEEANFLTVVLASVHFVAAWLSAFALQAFCSCDGKPTDRA